MVDIPTRFRERGGVSLGSHVIPHIYRAPPSSITTRKKERVTEADVTWMIRPDGPESDFTRIDENIQYFPHGINPSVKVEYQNRGGGSKTHYLHPQQAGSTYKISNVIPPTFPVESLLPLSRPRTHQNISVESNPGLPGGYASNSIASDIDQGIVTNAIVQAKSGAIIKVNPTAYYKIDKPMIQSARYAINENQRDTYQALTNPSANIHVDTSKYVCKETTPYGIIVRPNYTVTSNLKMPGGGDDRNDDASAKVKKEVLFQNIAPNFQITIYDPSNHVSSEVNANIKESTKIAVQAALGMPIMLDRSDGTHIKLKDYNWTSVQTNVGIDQLILTLDTPDIKLERNIPLYAASSSASMPTNVTSMTNAEYDLEGKVSAYADSNVNLSEYYDGQNMRNIQENTKSRKETYASSFDNQGYIPQYVRNAPPTKAREMSRVREAQSYHGRTFE